MGRIVAYVALVAIALTLALLLREGGDGGGARILAEAVLVGMGAYVFTHVVWPRWRRHRRLRPGQNRSGRPSYRAHDRQEV